MAINLLLKHSSWKQCAQDLYAFAVDLARQPFLYTDYKIPDTPEGRYELLVLHLFLILNRLKKENLKEVMQEICDLMVADMDHSLRDLRLSDLKIARQFKKFVEGFYGRLVAYDDALNSLNPDDLQTALLRNVYGQENDSNADSDDVQGAKDEGYARDLLPLATYMRTQYNHFSTLSLQHLIKGELNHVPPHNS